MPSASACGLCGSEPEESEPEDDVEDNDVGDDAEPVPMPKMRMCPNQQCGEGLVNDALVFRPTCVCGSMICWPCGKLVAQCCCPWECARCTFSHKGAKAVYLCCAKCEAQKPAISFD